jgi:hypothetical protein
MHQRTEQVVEPDPGVVERLRLLTGQVGDLPDLGGSPTDLGDARTAVQRPPVGVGGGPRLDGHPRPRAAPGRRRLGRRKPRIRRRQLHDAGAGDTQDPGSLGGAKTFGHQQDCPPPRRAASTAHTARAALALSQCRTSGLLPPRYEDLLSGALLWLRQEGDLRSTAEEIVRFVDSRRENLVVKHFTAAWVGRFLSALGLSLQDPLLAKTSRLVLEAYREPWWRWDTGEYPIWMTYQGLSTLVRVAVVPSSSDDEPRQSTSHS